VSGATIGYRGALGVVELECLHSDADRGPLAFGHERVEVVQVDQDTAGDAIRAELPKAGEPGFTKDPDARTFLEQAAELVSRGRDGYGDDHFLDVAVIYAHAWANGHSDPVAAVVKKWGCARSTAGRWVGRARNEFGFLEPTEERKPNGRLTRRTLRLIGQRR
jgi:hypothetical protein